MTRVGTIPAHSATVRFVESGGGGGIRTHDTARYSDLANRKRLERNACRFSQNHRIDAGFMVEESEEFGYEKRF